MCFLFAVIVIVERLWRLTFLRSLRLLVASRFAFKICFLAPCLWWESENTRVLLNFFILNHAGPRRAKKLHVYVFKNGAGKVCF